ncbi:unnamed protein product [Danaus chrysippus]|uniref:(African queen) hypothetical protein n=1 Tax=Danaus chrysippus TaxID=151541 RepID=A0A8J2QP34_9NEOP|nr:unnamed protein product [Danaus chrysippus]
MKIWTSEHTFNHPWETESCRRSVIHTHRLVSSKWFFPRWAQALIGTAKICYASEKSEVNPDKRVMTLKTANLTFCRYIAVDETVKYTPHPSDPSKTLLTQEAVVTVEGVPLSSYMEDLLGNKISLNAGKGRQAIEWVIGKLDSEIKNWLTQHARAPMNYFTRQKSHSMTSQQLPEDQWTIYHPRQRNH